MNDRPLSEPDPFDDLLQQAAWPDADSPRVARLQHEWDQLVSRRNRRHRLALVATLVVVSTTAYFSFRQLDHSTVVTNPAVEPAAPEPISPTDVTPVEPSPRENPSDVFEQQMLAALNRRLEQQHQLRIRQWQQADANPNEATSAGNARRRLTVDELVERQMSQPDQEPSQVVQTWSGAKTTLETQLIRFAQRRDVTAEQRIAAVQLLSTVASRRALPVLMQARRWPPVYETATMAMARLGTPVELRGLVQAETSREVRLNVATELFERGDPDAVAQVLAMTRQPDTSALVRQVARQSNRPPIPTLVAALQSPRVADRDTAALLLSECPHDQVTNVLVQLVLKNVSRREALTALVRRSDAQSTQFVRHAEADLLLNASVRAARAGAESLTN